MLAERGRLASAKRHVMVAAYRILHAILRATSHPTFDFNPTHTPANEADAADNVTCSEPGPSAAELARLSNRRNT
jgi:hypothetical protein